MCYSAWDLNIGRFVTDYLNAVTESQLDWRTEQHRHVWRGKAEGFKDAYPDKLREMSNEELQDWIDSFDDVDDIDEWWRTEIYDPAVAEQKRRAEEGEMVDGIG